MQIATVLSRIKVVPFKETQAVENREESDHSGWGISRKSFLKEAVLGKDLERGGSGDGGTRHQECHAS